MPAPVLRPRPAVHDRDVAEEGAHVLQLLDARPAPGGAADAQVGVVDRAQPPRADVHDVVGAGQAAILHLAPPALALQKGDKVRLPVFERAAVRQHVGEARLDFGKQIEVGDLGDGEGAGVLLVHHLRPAHRRAQRVPRLEGADGGVGREVDQAADRSVSHAVMFIELTCRPDRDFGE